MQTNRENNKRMLITGVSGLLGNNLAYYFKDKYEILGLYNSHPVNIKGIDTEKCELSCPDNIKKIISEFNPRIIIHCASLTNVDECEIDKDTTKTINVLSTKNIVEDIIDKDIKLIYISTDAVYDGVKGNFSENDNISPNNYYGFSKYQGELEILKKKDSLILRTNIFGWNIQNKKSLGEWILGELKAKQRTSGFKDAYFSSIYTMELARIIDISINRNLIGIYNCGSVDTYSKYEFGIKIAECFGFDKTLIAPISIDDFNFKARRGKNLTLNVNKLEKALDYKLPTINHSIEAFYRDYKCGLPEEIRKYRTETQKKPAFIPYGRQWIDEKDIRAVVNVLRSDRITQGLRIEEFENALVEYCGVKYAVAVNSGTSALHIACLAANIKDGDEVITSPNTFVASANCVVYCGAKPVFADIDKMTYNISPEGLAKKITKRTKAIIPVHFAGQSCDMEMISQVVKKAEEKYGHKIFIIEDACHALGSKYKGTEVGSCSFSDMSALSFHPVKHITTGEGGAVLTNDEKLCKKLRQFRSHGITSDPKDFINKDLAFPAHHSPNPWYYEQVDLGYNYRITDIQCALGSSQLKKLHKFRERRRQIVDKYNEAFSNIKSVQIPFESKDCNTNFHLYVLLFNFNQIGIDRAQFIIELKKRGIQTQVHYIPVHLQPFYQKNFGTRWGDCRNAEQYYQECLSIPLFPAMNDQDVERVINEITDVVKVSL
ncbi:MAG: UDP-4-amino-4,6-dideoxy-N-acetyl-beta-L-altrosamine transaminase [Desulfobacteraceae bacterium]|nr:UDP-4-amino-4,6-dideoxy-N-acetyl-beta-L-altrosamine transaminase [Desulfobacteraceae bacterium]